MITYHDIEPQIREVTKKTAQLAFMNKEQIFDLIAEVIAISDLLTNYIRAIDIKMVEATQSVVSSEDGKKMSAAMRELTVKQAVAKYKADKEWADRQLKLLSELRMAALAASTEM